MDQIDAILELASSIDLAGGEIKNATFKLYLDEKGKWSAVVSCGKYYVDANNADTADECLQKLRQELTRYNNSLLGRLKSIITKWTSTSPLRVVKNDPSGKTTPVDESVKQG